MGYERNDRRFGGAPGDRDRGYDADRARSYGDDYGSRDYRGDRFADRGNYRRDYESRGRDDDRGFLDRAGDEVRSWFGDEEAERRRREDERHGARDDRGYGDRGYGERSARDYGARDHARGFSGYGTSSYDNGRYSSGSYDQQDRAFGGGTRDQHRDTYQSWRDRQMQSFDQDYDEYRREHQSKFDSEFHSWRQSRQGQRDLLKMVQEHQEVVGSDGQHVGKVDHVRGDTIRLAKNDQAAGGHHHSIPSSWLQSVDDKVTLSKTAEQAKQHWRDEDRNEGGLFGGGRDDTGGSANLNRSFSGTY